MKKISFRNLLIKIGEVIEARTISHPKVEKMEDYANGDYNPKFDIVLRDGELLCIWCGNVKKPVGEKQIGGDLVIDRWTENRLRNGLEPDEWDSLGLRIKRTLWPKKEVEQPMFTDS